MADDLDLPFEPISSVRVATPVGCCLDIPTGSYVKGDRGQMILNGGFLPIVGIVGENNCYKSTIASYMCYSAMAKYIAHKQTRGLKYDTETNSTHSRESDLAESVPGLEGENNPVENGRFVLTDKTKYSGTAYFKLLKGYYEKKLKEAKSFTYQTKYLDKDGKPFQYLTPTFNNTDSLTEFDTDDVLGMREDNDLGDSGGNTIFMRQGLAKTRFLSELPTIVGKGNFPTILTAHVGEKINMNGTPPPKSMSYMKNGLEIKGVTKKFGFLTQIVWLCSRAVPLLDNDKRPQYPADKSDDSENATDLNLITATLLRNKYGGSGTVIQIIASQESGLLPTLTEFHYIRTNKSKEWASGYGVEGNDRSFYLHIYPETKMSRNTVRQAIDADPKLTRAINITSELCQITYLWNNDGGLICPISTLFEDLKNIGYDWDTLLQTVGFKAFYDDGPNELSTWDLLRMRKGQYVPYWWPKDKPLDMTKCVA
jgi:hypothetical protein